MWGDLQIDVTLSRGLVDERGIRHRHARLRTLSGFEEAALSSAGERLARDDIHHLLSACLLSIGDYELPEIELVAALSLGDQTRLLLSLRRLLFGDRITLMMRCANPSCAEAVDTSMTVDELLEFEPMLQAEWIEVETAQGVAQLRPPSGADELACQLPTLTERERIGLLWVRLLKGVGKHRCNEPSDWWGLPADTRQTIALALAEVDDDGLDIISQCPECAAPIELRVDPAILLVRELRLGAQRLSAELHCLAYHYGWTESEALALSRQRRWQYLGLLTRELEGRPLLDGWS